jgi:hypothetical protein
MLLLNCLRLLSRTQPRIDGGTYEYAIPSHRIHLEKQFRWCHRDINDSLRFQRGRQRLGVRGTPCCSSHPMTRGEETPANPLYSIRGRGGQHCRFGASNVYKSAGRAETSSAFLKVPRRSSCPEASRTPILEIVKMRPDAAECRRPLAFEQDRETCFSGSELIRLASPFAPCIYPPSEISADRVCNRRRKRSREEQFSQTA